MFLALSDFFKRKKEHLKLPEIQQIIDELAAQVQGPYLSLYEILEWREQLFMAPLMPYPPSLSFKIYYTQHCGILGTGITFKSYNLTTISSIAIQATLPQKHSSKYLTKTVDKMAQKVVGSTNMHQSWVKYEDSAHFEVGQQNSLLAQKPKRRCCEIILELFLMKNAFEAMKDESDFRRQPYQFNATGKYVYTYIIQSELQKQDRAKQYVFPLKELQQHEKSKHMNEMVHWNYWSQCAIYMLLLKQARDIYIPPQGIYNQYINITQYDIAEYIKKEGHRFKNMTQAQFNDKCQTLLNQFDIQSQKSAQEHRNNYAIITFTDERLLGFVNDFSKQMHYRTRIFQWNSAKFMKVKDFYQKWGMLKHDRKAFKQQIIKKQLLTQEEQKMRTEVLKISVGQYFEILSEIIEESPIYREILYGGQMYSPSIQQKLKRDNQNGIPIKQNNKVDASPLPKNETYLQQNDRLIKDSQKRVEMLSCWKELMVQCKYRCKVGANCQCQVNRRQLQSEERYLQKLYKYRDYYQSSQNQKKTLFPKVSNENQSPTQIKNTIVEPLSTKAESPSVQPLKKVENGETMSPRLNQKKKKHKEGGDFQWNRLKLKQTIWDYDEQELNLMNMLDRMNFGEYRAPCNVEESKVDIWKKMGEKYRKNSQNRKNSKKK